MGRTVGSASVQFGTAIVFFLLGFGATFGYPGFFQHLLEQLRWKDAQHIVSSITVTYIATAVAMFALIRSVIAYIRNFFNRIPGPLAAKRSIYWKLDLVRKGTYDREVRDLHNEHGALVQVGPFEYSVSDTAYFEQCSKLQKSSLAPSFILRLYHSNSILISALDMANIFHYEANIDRCIHDLLQALFSHSESGEDVDMAELIARYAYDTLFATTTGKAPGFLTRPLDIAKLTQAMTNWKLQAVAYGSYLRFHRIIRTVLGLLNSRQSFEYQLLEQLDIDTDRQSRCVLDRMLSAPNGFVADRGARHARVALIIAGADPTITHIFTSLYYIYCNRRIVERLRAEIQAANISQPPTIKQLIHCKPRMPLLHAVLEESLRLHQPHTNGFSYVSPKGGVTIDGKHVPQDCTICLEPSIAHLNSDIFGEDAYAFNPDRWLRSPELARNLKHHMVAFGAGTTQCPGRDLHTAITAKVLTQVIPHFDLNMSTVNICTSPTVMSINDLEARFVPKVSIPKGVNPISTVSSPLNAAAPTFAPETTTGPELPPGFTPHKATATDSPFAVGKYVSKESMPKVAGNVLATPAPGTSISRESSVESTTVTWSDERTLEEIVGRETTNELLNRLDPTKKLRRQAYIRTSPIIEPRNRFLMHEVVGRVWAGQLAHVTDPKTQGMYIWVPGSRIPKWLERTYKFIQQNPRQHGSDTSSTSDGKPPAQVPSQRPAPAKAPLHAGWGAFAVEATVQYTAVQAKSRDEYRAERGITKVDTKAEVHVHEDVKEALPKSEPKTNGKQIFMMTCNAETTNGKLGGPRKVLSTEPGAEYSAAAVEETTNVPKKSALPPHLRARAASPPHLRARAAETAEVNKVDIDVKAESSDDSEGGVWVAARLPMPF